MNSLTIPLEELPGMEAHASGTLWLTASRTAIVADAHLGYGWAQRRRGELGPLADFRARDKLMSMAQALAPERIVFLGDLVHAPRPCEPERQWIESALLDLSRRATLVAVRGNHDRAFARDFGQLPIALCETWSNEILTAVHGDRLNAAPIPADRTLVLGHLHPSFAVRDAAGASRKLPVFLVSEGCIVLPAFSPFARGYEVTEGLPVDLRHCFRGKEPQVFAVTGTRVARLGPLNHAIEKMAGADVSGGARFRKARAGF